MGLDLGSLRSALIIAPHGDDEVLGAGGLIAKLVESAATVHVAFMSIDSSSHYGYPGETKLGDRRREIIDASAFLGFQFEIVFEGRGMLEKLDTLPKRTLVDLFESKINAVQPDILLLPSGDDYDQDHAACYEAALAASRPIPANLGKFFVPKVVTYESPKIVWAQKPFKPDLYVDISSQLKKKLASIEKYRTQLRQPPHIRSLANIEALARLRGAEAGCEFAEAFSVLRWAI
jgi:LmbE family N-acetylglucosaminyl deacetylase